MCVCPETEAAVCVCDMWVIMAASLSCCTLRLKLLIIFLTFVADPKTASLCFCCHDDNICSKWNINVVCTDVVALLESFRQATQTHFLLNWTFPDSLWWETEEGGKGRRRGEMEEESGMEKRGERQRERWTERRGSRRCWTWRFDTWTPTESCCRRRESAATASPRLHTHTKYSSYKMITELNVTHKLYIIRAHTITGCYFQLCLLVKSKQESPVPVQSCRFW